VGQLQQPITAIKGVTVGNHVGGGAAQDDHGAGELCQLQGHLSGMVMGGAVLLLVGPLMLFVYDDKAQVGLGSEDGAARADDDAIAPLLYAPPLVEVLSTGEAAVKERHLAGKASPKPLYGLRGEGELWDHDDAPLSLAEGVGQCTKVDLRFAAASDAVEQEDSG
jgi:hypothetical protein